MTSSVLTHPRTLMTFLLQRLEETGIRNKERGGRREKRVGGKEGRERGGRAGNEMQTVREKGQEKINYKRR